MYNFKKFGKPYNSSCNQICNQTYKRNCNYVVNIIEMHSKHNYNL